MDRITKLQGSPSSSSLTPNQNTSSSQSKRSIQPQEVSSMFQKRERKNNQSSNKHNLSKRSSSSLSSHFNNKGGRQRSPSPSQVPAPAPAPVPTPPPNKWNQGPPPLAKPIPVSPSILAPDSNKDLVKKSGNEEQNHSKLPSSPPSEQNHILSRVSMSPQSSPPTDSSPTEVPKGATVEQAENMNTNTTLQTLGTSADSLNRDTLLSMVSTSPPANRYYKDQQIFIDECERSVFVGNIPAGVLSQHLRPFFAPFGQIEAVYVKDNQPRKGPTTYGFVRYVDTDSVARILGRNTDISIGSSILVIRSRDIKQDQSHNQNQPQPSEPLSNTSGMHFSKINSSPSTIAGNDNVLPIQTPTSSSTTQPDSSREHSPPRHDPQSQSANLLLDSSIINTGNNMSPHANNAASDMMLHNGSPSGVAAAPSLTLERPGSSPAGHISSPSPPPPLPPTSFTYGKVLHISGIPVQYSAKTLYDAFNSHVSSTSTVDSATAEEAATSVNAITCTYIYSEPDMLGGKQGLVEVETGDLAKRFIEKLNPLSYEGSALHINPSILPCIEMPRKEEPKVPSRDEMKNEEVEEKNENKSGKEDLQPKKEETACEKHKDQIDVKKQNEEKLDWSEVEPTPIIVDLPVDRPATPKYTRVPQLNTKRSFVHDRNSSSTTCQIHINNIDIRAVSDKRALSRLFEKFGRIVNAKFVVRENTKVPGGRPVAFSFVEFGDRASATRAIAAMHRKVVGQLPINVKYADNGGNRRNANAHADVST